MGTASSRQFQQALRKGGEEAALDLYLNKEDLRAMNPSKLCGIVRRTSPLHYSAKRGFVRLFKEFVSRGGDPNAENYMRQSVVHEICTAVNGDEPEVARGRVEMLKYLIAFCNDPSSAVTVFPVGDDGCSGALGSGVEEEEEGEKSGDKREEQEGKEKEEEEEEGKGEKRGDKKRDEEQKEEEEEQGTDENSSAPRQKPQFLNLNKQDSSLNTPLHLAAVSGLTGCVQLLLTHGASPHLENIAKQTPLDCAEAAGNTDIVALLEPRVVFTESKSTDLLRLKQPFLQQESYQGVNEQELQETKDSLILHMSTLLGVSLSNATALLQAHGWSKELLVNAWFQDSQAACDQAKIRLPLGHHDSISDVLRQQSVEERECEICTEAITEATPIPCCHSFCKECWKAYLEVKITEGQVAKLECPGFNCDRHVPHDVISSLVSKEIDAKYIKFALDAFVETSTNLKWCPHPGCGRAIRLLGTETDATQEDPDSAAAQPDSTGAEADDKKEEQKKRTPRAVDCGLGHFFCWACGSEPHDPCNCDLWKQWKEEVVKEEGADSATASTQAISDAWVAKHSRPCPQCGVPIQKTDGCNHMTCSKCSHDFCWVCLGKWSIHGSLTGGYFTCNRFRSARNAEKRLQLVKEAAAERAKRSKSRVFKHVHSRYANHLQSLKYEEPFLEKVKEKATALIVAAIGSSVRISEDEIDGKFVQNGVRELLKARRVLCASYALCYFIPRRKSQDQLIKLLAPLEKSTETLAEMITREHLRTPKDKIVLATVESREVRRKFLSKARKFNPKIVLESDPLDLEDESEDPESLEWNSFDDDSDNSGWDDDTDDDWDTDLEDDAELVSDDDLYVTDLFVSQESLSD